MTENDKCDYGLDIFEDHKIAANTLLEIMRDIVLARTKPSYHDYFSDSANLLLGVYTILSGGLRYFIYQIRIILSKWHKKTHKHSEDSLLNFTVRLSVVS